jgi:hypothetical protein
MKENYVADISNSRLLAEVNNPRIRRSLKELGARSAAFFDRSKLEILISNSKHAASVIEKLIELDFYFVGGEAGWPPVEVVQHFVDEGLIKEGEIKIITWSGPGKVNKRSKYLKRNSGEETS